jgi:S-adenosylmethionine synthetase
MELQLAYAIGVAKPVSIACETFGTNHVPENVIDRVVRECFDLRPAKILENLRLRRPIYHATAAYGHFGRTDIDAPWEETDKVEQLRAEAGLDKSPASVG